MPEDNAGQFISGVIGGEKPRRVGRKIGSRRIPREQHKLAGIPVKIFHDRFSEGRSGINAVMGAKGCPKQFAAEPGAAAFITKNKTPAAGMSGHAGMAMDKE